MPNIQIFVKLISKSDMVNITAITDTITINRTLPLVKLDTKIKLANWILSQTDTSIVEQDEARQGVLSFDYHIEQVDDGEGNLVDTKIIDGVVNHSPLPLIFRRDLSSLLNQIDDMSSTSVNVKNVLKQLTKAVWFLGNV